MSLCVVADQLIALVFVNLGNQMGSEKKNLRQLGSGYTSRRKKGGGITVQFSNKRVLTRKVAYAHGLCSGLSLRHLLVAPDLHGACACHANQVGWWQLVCEGLPTQRAPWSRAQPCAGSPESGAEGLSQLSLLGLASPCPDR